MRERPWLFLLILPLVLLVFALLWREPKAAPAKPNEKPSAANTRSTLTSPGAESVPADEQRELAAPEAAAEEPEAGPVERALQGVLLDEVSGDPIPNFSLSIWADYDEHDRQSTDDQGRFETVALPLDKEFEIFWDDNPEDTASYDATRLLLAELEPGEQIFRLPVGPTYFLDVQAPAHVVTTELVAKLASPTERGNHRRRAGYSAQLRLAENGDHWVRFDNWSVRGKQFTGPWILDVFSPDGLWWGEAQVDSVTGVYPSIVAVNLGQTGAVEGRVVDTDGQPVARAWISLRSETEGNSGGGTEDDGSFFFGALTAGEWTLVIEPREHQRAERTFTVEPGIVQQLEVRLPAPEPVGSVRGRVVSATGQFHDPDCTLFLRGTGEVHANLRQAVVWEERDGEWLFEFEFPDVPAGELELGFGSRTCPFEISPGWKQTVSTPADGVEVRILDDVPTSDLGFRIVDAETGEPIETVGAWWMSPGAWARWQRDIAPDELVIEGWPDGRPLDWILGKDGYAMAFGDWGAFLREGDARVAEVRLERGWGAQFFVQEAGDQDGLEGLYLRFDGVEVGPTRARGRLPLAFPQRPQRIEVATPGWRIIGGNVDPASGAFDDENWWALTVQLERVE